MRTIYIEQNTQNVRNISRLCLLTPVRVAYIYVEYCPYIYALYKNILVLEYMYVYRVEYSMYLPTLTH